MQIDKQRRMYISKKIRN